jgi:hypothetical protein
MTEDKITHIKPKTHQGFVTNNTWQEIIDTMRTFYDPLAESEWKSKKLKDVDHAYIQSLLAVDTILKRQRKEINKKIKAIKTALTYIEENR